MALIEKLGVFYLGRVYDPAKQKVSDQPLMYDAKDLVTHAVCVGMTGSGKTGLCISLLEEAAIDRLPAIIIDPKGDLGNLLLTFPSLRPEDFRPWVDEDEAARQGLSAEAFAAQQAELWKKGIAEWGMDASRLKLFRDSVDLTIYTPGSNAGLPVSALRSFAAPSAKLVQDDDFLRDRVATTAARSASRTYYEKQDIQRAQEQERLAQERMAVLEKELQQEAEEMTRAFDPEKEKLQEIVLRPKKMDISVRWAGLLWVPYWQVAGGGVETAF